MTKRTKGFVKLGGMAQFMAGGKGEIHAPGNRGYLPVELTVGEVSDPAERVPQRKSRAEKTGEVPEINPSFMAEDKRCDNDSVGIPLGISTKTKP